MNKLIVLAALFACALGAPQQRLVLPRLPLKLLLQGNMPLVEPRIVGGSEVVPNSLPFQISLQRSGIFGYSHSCGGSIVNANFIVDAAHCVIGASASSFRVVAGEHDLTVTSGFEQNRSVKKVTMHPEYNTNTFENDVAVLQLSTPLDLTSAKVQPIALNGQGVETAAGTTAYVSGWGTTSSGGDIPDKLRKVAVPVISDKDCYNAYSGATVASMLCAGDIKYGGIDSCQGDSGGPLFTDKNGKFTLIGIVSWGYGCAAPGYPGVYSQVSYYNNYINSVIQSAEF
jgi:trypsin